MARIVRTAGAELGPRRRRKNVGEQWAVAPRERGERGGREERQRSWGLDGEGFVEMLGRTGV